MSDHSTIPVSPATAHQQAESLRRKLRGRVDEDLDAAIETLSAAAPGVAVSGGPDPGGDLARLTERIRLLGDAVWDGVHPGDGDRMRDRARKIADEIDALTAPAAPTEAETDLAPDDWRRFSTSQVRGALGWWLYAVETGDEEGGTYALARDAIGHENADRLERLRAAPTEAETEGGNEPEDAFRDAVVDLLRRAGRMRDGWAESDKAGQNALWRSLHTAADHVGAILDAEAAQPWRDELHQLDAASFRPGATGAGETEDGDVCWSRIAAAVREINAGPLTDRAVERMVLAAVDTDARVRSALTGHVTGDDDPVCDCTPARVGELVAALAAPAASHHPYDTAIEGGELRWEYRLEPLLVDGVHGYRCPLCGEEGEATLDDLASYDRVKGHLLSHDPTLLAGALIEARSWARHGYEIGQRGAGWSDMGVAPAWLTEGHDPATLAAPRPGATGEGGGGWTLTGDALYGAASERARQTMPAAISTPLAGLFANLAYYRGELAGSWHEAGEALARGLLRTEAAFPRPGTTGEAGDGDEAVAVLRWLVHADELPADDAARGLMTLPYVADVARTVLSKTAAAPTPATGSQHPYDTAGHLPEGTPDGHDTGGEA